MEKIGRVANPLDHNETQVVNLRQLESCATEKDLSTALRDNLYLVIIPQVIPQESLPPRKATIP